MHDTIYDAEKDIAAVVDSVHGFALGPTLAGGERAVQLLDTFIGSLEKDISEIHPFTLGHLWHSFVAAMTEDEPADAGPSAEAPPAAADSSPPAEAAAGSAPPESAQLGEVGGLAGPAVGTEQAAPGDQPGGGNPGGEVLPTGQRADGGLPTGIETAAPAGGEAPAAAAPAAAETAPPAGDAAPADGGGIPKAPAA